MNFGVLIPNGLRWVAFTLFLLMSPQAVPAEPPPAQKRPTHILIVTPDDVFRPLVHDFIVSFRSALSRTHTNSIQFHTESLDFNRVLTPAEETRLADHYRSKYAERKLDLVLTIAAAPLGFIVRNRDTLFPGVPVVFASTNPKDVNEGNLPDWVTGVPSGFDPTGTLQLALQLQPDAREVVVVTGTAAYDQSWEQIARAAYAPFEARVRFRYVSQLPLPRMLEELARLPKESIIIYYAVNRDAAGHHWTGLEVLRRSAALASAPTYSVFESAIGNGSVGGFVSHPETDGQETAALVARVLAGERNIPVQPSPPNFHTVDWRQMKRWNLREANLPPGSVVRFRPPSVWTQYKWYVLATLAIIMAQGSAITGLLIHRARRRRAENHLRESEERMTLAAEAGQLGLWLWDISANSIWLTDKLRELLGYSATEKVTYENFLMRVHEEDRLTVAQAVQKAVAEVGRYRSEYRVVLPDGTLRWLSGSGRVKADSAGTPVQMLGVSIDITERHRVEAESRQVSGKLITAQEDERKRIARDLHDDLNQRLALLSIEMELFGTDSKDTRGSARDRLGSMTSQVKDLSSEVHRLSYQLHPAKLDQLGLLVAARTFCREISAQSGIPVHFEQHAVPRDVRADVALCLYRVIQEALQNSVRHNGGVEIFVRLKRDEDQIRLFITDEGKGFDVDHAMHNGGLGMVSMRERVRQVHGSIVVTSAPGKGTQIEVNVPLLPEAAGR